METLINAAPDPADLIKDSDQNSFMADVIEASRETPVIVDFWAPWCGPCKQLGPALEKVVKDAGGAVRMVKVNIDENPAIAQQMRVQSIPAVFAFFQGRPVDGFQGALPESQIREFVKRLTGGAAGDSPLDEALDAADQMMEAGDAQGAGGIYSQVVQHDPENIRGNAGLIRALVAIGQVEQAQQVIEQLPDAVKKAPEVHAAISSLELASESVDAGEEAELLAAIDADPDNHQARYDLAMARFAGGDREGAVEALIESIRRDREWEEQKARKQLVKFFEAFGHTDPVTIQGRRKLSAVLFS
ncbi:thioredoxin [Nisaea acidiphila]|uniref:Thioredoxin n=1 Tax=Nisaea acidiphila TaxID=1862145 RepID=A0A9J7ALF4_9PROT|nr:thioredoxin [Nisaea acidiphila]UUX47990.1 thioredoxin [Nisaea acidiphila]